MSRSIMKSLIISRSLYISFPWSISVYKTANSLQFFWKERK